LSGNNFGCGSSREHAPQAIQRAGFNAVIAGSFAEIFFGNSTNLGIVCVTAGDAERETLAAAIEADPGMELTIDVAAGEIRYGESNIPCEIKANARESLMSGNYDPLDELLEGAGSVDSIAGALPYMQR
jgi:3-isopropylmalate/(R)-2-methylmalate dehydratase small subunit